MNSGGDDRKRFRRMENGRLAYYMQSASREFWEEHWAQTDLEKAYEFAIEGRLGYFERWFTRYLPQNGNLIEAGCGLSQYVLALRQRGYDIEGIDWAHRTVDMVKRRFPNLPVRVGNILGIDAPDDYYSGYISLGVVEHRAGGPEPFFREALRVLKPEGTAIFTVPFINVVRSLKAASGAFPAMTAEGEFYQYAFTKNEFIRLLGQNGFAIVATGAYDSYKGIFDEFPKLKRLTGKQLGPYHIGSAIQTGLSKFNWVENRFGHMLLVVARKPGLRGSQ